MGDVFQSYDAVESSRRKEMLVLRLMWLTRHIDVAGGQRLL